MNPFISDRIAHERTDGLLADAAAIRRLSRARSYRRGAAREVSTQTPADRSPARRRSPVAAFQAWLAAGQL